MPVLEEPMHRLVFRNDRIDVYSVRMNPGESSVYHRHRRDQLGIVLRSTRSLGQILGSQPQPNLSTRGAISYIPHSTIGALTHRVSTPFGREFWVIGIEFTQPGGPAATRAMAAPDQAVLDFPQGKITRVEIGPGSRQTVSGDLIVALTPGQLTIDREVRPLSLEEGAVKWIGGARARFTNPGRRPASLIVLTLADR
ncbi:hypothetical protein [Tardibacter chloracetimidivorans]|nr:hypothetical protein [Tardibacter chloracetimidivorans]